MEKSQKIELGLTVLLTEKRSWLQGKSIGLITNQTGVDANVRSNYQLFGEAMDCRLAAIFSPEHGFWGAAQDGVAMETSGASLCGSRGATVPVFSLYGSTLRPTADHLKDIEVLIYDMQDVGVRYYTYLSTLLYAMEAASERGITCIVADRPNPITCTAVEGGVLANGFESFVGVHRIPIRYGLTIGELARLLKAERVPSCRLKVAWMRKYARGMWYDDTGLQWVPPSPNMPTLTTATVYPGVCLFEGTNMSEGRGTTKPFEYVGAPWCDGERWAATLNALELPGVRFRSIVFTPAPVTETTKHAGQACGGVAIHVIDRERFRPIETAVVMLSVVISEYREHFAFLVPHFDRLAGNRWLRKALLAGTSGHAIQEQWSVEQQTWSQKAARYHTYL